MQSISRIDYQTPVTSVVITIRSYYLPRMPSVPSAERHAEQQRIGTEKNRAIEHSAALSRRAHTSRVYISVSRPFFLHGFSLSFSPPFLDILVIIKDSVPSLYNADPPLSFRASNGSVFEQVLRNSRFMRRPDVQVKRIMAFNE